MKILTTILILFVAQITHAQTWDEWFRQKKTKKKYLLQQIAALQVYIGYAEKGYQIASTGIHAIQDIKNGEFSLHAAYFSSLKSVNPAIKNAAEVGEIIALQISIVQHFKSAIRSYRQSQQFNNNEIMYFNNVFTELTDDCLQDIEELMNVISNNKLQMTDDERIKEINKLYADMQDKNSFTQSFTNNGFLLAQQRANEANNVGVARQLYNTK